jgi:hypothetical protein
MTPTSAPTPIEAPRADSCVLRGCDEPRAKDSNRCAAHRWQQWAGTPEWVLRARARRLSTRIEGGSAA